MDNYIWPGTQAGVLYEDRYLLGTSLARPCILRDMMKVVNNEGAAFISHGATGKGNDQVRFELAAYALKPDIQIVSPWKIPEFYNRFKGRVDLFEYADKNNIPLPVTPKNPWSMDANLMHISYESGILEHPEKPAPDDIYLMTKNFESWPNTPDILQITFKRGMPITVENTSTKQVINDSLEILKYLNKIG